MSLARLLILSAAALAAVHAPVAMTAVLTTSAVEASHGGSIVLVAGANSADYQYDGLAAYLTTEFGSEHAAGAAQGLFPAATTSQADFSAAEALPEALTLGRNAEAGVDVYIGVRNGEASYAGITNNLARRAAQHGSRFDQLDQLTTSSMTRGEARAIEQAMIVRNPEWENIANSISPSHDWYQQAVDWGENWLRSNGY